MSESVSPSNYSVIPERHVGAVSTRVVSDSPIAHSALSPNTVYKALLKANLRPGEWVVIPGAGGGLGHLAVQVTRPLLFIRCITEGKILLSMRSP